MKSFGCGNYTVRASSIEQGQLIVQALERLDRAKARREYLRSINHGHTFGYNRNCINCGLLERNYRDNLSCDPLNPHRETAPYEVCSKL